MIQKFIKSIYIKDFIRFALGYFVCALLGLITTAIVNQKLNQYELGEYSYTKSLFELLVSTFSLGLYSAYLRFNVNGDNIRFKKIVQCYISIIVVILFILFYMITGKFAASLYCIVLFFNERTYYYRSILKTKRLNILRISSGALTLFCIIIFSTLFANQLGSSIILFCYALGYSLSIVFYFFSNSEPINTDVIPFSTILKYCVPGALLTIIDWLLIFLTQSIIKEYYGFSDLAPYAIAQRALLVIKLISSLYLMFYPTIYFKEIERKNYAFIRKSRFFIVLSLIIYLFICFLLSNEIYLLVGAKKYISYVDYFRILLFAELFKVLASLYGLYLTYKIKTFHTFIILIFGVILNLTCVYMFIERFGVIAVCYSSMFAYAVVFVMMIFYSFIGEKKYLRKYI